MRRMGWKVRVSHLRRGWAVLKELKNKHLPNGEKEYSIVRVNDDIAHYHQSHIPGFAIYPTGGRTELHITDKENNNYYCSHQFDQNESYNKKLGVELALAKMECFY